MKHLFSLLAAICLIATWTLRAEEENTRPEKEGEAARERGNRGGKHRGRRQHRPMGPHHKELIEKFDQDGDGKLSPDEREAAHKEMLKKFDANGNGEIDPEEHEAILKDRTAEFVKKHDADGDGKLSADELSAARLATMKDRSGRGRRGGPQREKMMKAFDKDGDGTLSEEEKKELRKEMQKRRGKRHGKGRGKDMPETPEAE